MLRKNVASQFVYFSLINAANGAALTSATAAGFRCLDSGAQASVTGSFTEIGGGQYRFNASQADTNGDYVGYLFTATGAVPVSANFITTGGNFSDGVHFGLTSLPNAAAAASGGLLTVGTSSGQITPASGHVTLDLTQAVPTSNTAQTVGDAFNAARAQGFGKWALSGTTLTLYAADGSTVVRTFTLNSATAPTSRT